MTFDLSDRQDMNPAEPYPVMIYFYGGGYESGGNIQYPGHFLAARNVIVVVPNYRVGIFGIRFVYIIYLKVSPLHV